MKKIEIYCEDEHQEKFAEIFQALIRCGGLSGVKNGRTVIHFDHDGNFRGIQLDYWPWKKRFDKKS